MPTPAPLRPLLALGLSFCLLLAAGGAAAGTPFEARCEAALDGASRRPAINVEAHNAGYRVDNSLSYRALTRIKRERPGGFVLGLTRAESRVAISVEGTIAADPDSGLECMSPRIAVSLSYPPIVVYVGSEFAPGTCAYREILAHEMRHLKAYVEYLPKVERTVRASMASRFDGRPVVAPQGQALARVQAELDERWMPFIKREMGRAKALQASIDSAGEYARLSKVCQGEVQSLIGSTRHLRSSTSS
jgi:hypothetical protein